MITYNTPLLASSIFNAAIELNFYEFRLKWNTTNSSWYIDIYNTNGVISTGVKILPYTNIFRYRKDLSSKGIFTVINIKNSKEPLGRNNLGYGKDYLFVYMTNEELGNG